MRPTLDEARYMAALEYFDADEEDREAINKRAEEIRSRN